MKLVWCPDRASKVYIAGVKVLADRDVDRSTMVVAELASAMAGGWNAQLVVEAPYVPAAASRTAATTLALAAAACQTGGRYVCVVPNEESAAAVQKASGGLVGAATVMVGDAVEVMGRLEGVDLLVVDARRGDAAAVLSATRPGARGMVVVRHGGGRRLIATSMAVGTRVVRSACLPIGKGVDVLHIGVGKGPGLQGRSGGGRASRWVRYVDRDTGVEHVVRR